MSWRRAAVAFVVGLAVGGAVVYGWQERDDDDEQPARPPAAFSEVPADTARAVAERFRPWLRFDSRERWRPLNVAHLLAERDGNAPAHAFCTRTRSRNDCGPLPSEQALTARVREERAFGAESFLNLAGQRLAEYRAPGGRCAPLLDCGTAPGSAIYYRVTQSNDRYYADYWWFFRYNNFARSRPEVSCAVKQAVALELCGEHEGDWEGVTVVTRPGDGEAADYVVYAAHRGTFRYAASELRLHEGRRPEVFVARGSHASYPVACDGVSRGCGQPAELAAAGLVPLPEGRFDGGASWERNAESCAREVPDSCLLALPRVDRDARAWTVWPGRWGAGCQAVCGRHDGVSSPKSPGLQTRYQTPWCSTRSGNLVCDQRALVCGDWLGPLVAVVACSPRPLARGLASPTETQTGTLTVRLNGRDTSTETVPGVVQVLATPVRPGTTVTVSGGTPMSQVLLRAQRDTRLYEARFDRLDLGPGRSVTFTVARFAESDRDVILARSAGQPPRRATELRISDLELDARAVAEQLAPADAT